MNSSDKNYWNDLAKKALDDEEAFIELYNHFFPLVYRNIFIKTQREDFSDEITSQVFLKAFKNLHLFDETKSSFATWIFTITRNEFTSFLREKARLSPEILVEDFFASDSDFYNLEDDFFRQELNRELMEAITKLSEREQKIINLKYWLDFSNIDIAKLFNLEPHNVTVILGRAKKKLKKFLSQGGET